MLLKCSLLNLLMGVSIQNRTNTFESMLLTYYLKKLQSLKIDRSKGAPAPHKPILALSILQSIADGTITENKIYITAELVARFKDNWHLLVHNPRFTSNFALPFYHLKSEGWWHLKTYPGKEILLTSSNSIRSFSHLKEAVAYACLSEDFYQIIQVAANREYLMQALMHTYFDHVSGDISTTSGYGIVQQVEKQILHESPATYKAQTAVADEEEIFIRGGVFKKVVPRVYNYTCCITGMRLVADREVQMIDACHIVPFAESHDDTISNGLSLCPNLHRAFDRYLVSIDINYCVLVSPNLSESVGDYSIKRLTGKRILLPSQKAYFPSIENLKMHNDKFYSYQ